MPVKPRTQILREGIWCHERHLTLLKTCRSLNPTQGPRAVLWRLGDCRYLCYSPTRRWFYQWNWQCSKSWSHSQNSLCSQISIRGVCACGMLDRGCLLWFTTVYYYVNGKTRRVHSRGRLLLSVDHVHMASCMDFIRDARAGHAINTCTHAKQKTMYTAVIGKILNFSWEKCVTSR